MVRRDGELALEAGLVPEVGEGEEDPALVPGAPREVSQEPGADPQVVGDVECLLLGGAELTENVHAGIHAGLAAPLS